VLSTPPEQAEITRVSPTVFLISFNDFSIKSCALNIYPISPHIKLILALSFLALP
jgi:hypothetical protein